MKHMPKRGDTVNWPDNQNKPRAGLVMDIDTLTDSVLISPHDTRPGDVVWVDRALLSAQRRYDTLADLQARCDAYYGIK